MWQPSVDAVWKYTCSAPVFGSLAIDLSTGLGTNVFTPGTDPNTYVCTYLFKQFTFRQEQFSTYISPYVMSSRCEIASDMHARLEVEHCVLVSSWGRESMQRIKS
jgi:hypothetical protein